MMTIKEMSELTGVSARALRYYDEIGLFHPNGRSEAGYRLYDEKELEVLRQILYFRELDIPLRTIKEIIENPALDRKSILQTQKKMLISEKERLERLIDSIDVALKGANTMDFTVFNKEESSKMFSAMLEHMPDEIRDTAIKEFGSVEEWRAHYLNAVSSEEVQKQYAKIVEWYGGKEAYFDTVMNPLSEDVRKGVLTPKSFRWTDGSVYEIQRVKDIRRAASLKAGGVGMRYTCIVNGRESYLYYEDNNMWFMERAGA